MPRNLPRHFLGKLPYPYFWFNTPFTFYTCPKIHLHQSPKYTGSNLYSGLISVQFKVPASFLHQFLMLATFYYFPFFHH